MMRSVKWIGTAVGALTFLAFSASAAAQCGGFRATPDGGRSATAVCPAVQWVTSRAITVGCTSTTRFSRATSVTRLQMATFMLRVGKALTPVELGPYADTTPSATPPNPREDLSGW